ncbi:MAG: hypothetical protein KatS3mg068_2305 [Candidatus Sericytochromatia bacterium]|nr:MAG: hypothetical protein KatS3mg068_2305 [Candidatus Sericytochromatia bacterium]
MNQKGKILGIINIFDLIIVISLISVVIGILLNSFGYSSLKKKVIAEGIAKIKVGIRGARVIDPKIFEKHKKVFIIIRNQPHANLDVLEVKANRRPLIFYDQEKHKAIKVDNFEDNLITDVDITLQGQAQLTNDDPPSISYGR